MSSWIETGSVGFQKSSSNLTLLEGLEIKRNYSSSSFDCLSSSSKLRYLLRLAKRINLAVCTGDIISLSLPSSFSIYFSTLYTLLLVDSNFSISPINFCFLCTISGLIYSSSSSWLSSNFNAWGRGNSSVSFEPVSGLKTCFLSVAAHIMYRCTGGSDKLMICL